MQQPQFDLFSQLQQHPMCRWPIFTGLLALLVGLTVINCGTRTPAQVFSLRLPLAERQRDARRDDEAAGVTHWQPSTVDLGKRCDPRRWSFASELLLHPLDKLFFTATHGGRKRATVDT